MSSPGGALVTGEARLRRPIVARIGDGWAFQPFLTLALGIQLVLIVLVGYVVGPQVLLLGAAELPFWAVWTVGVTAGARADRQGVSWRYFVPRRFAWHEVSEVRFTRRHRLNGWPLDPVVAMVAGGRQQIVNPSRGVGNRNLKRFADDLSALARGAGVPVRADPDDRFWTELLAGELTR